MAKDRVQSRDTATGLRAYAQAKMTRDQAKAVRPIIARVAAFPYAAAFVDLCLSQGIYLGFGTTRAGDTVVVYVKQGDDMIREYCGTQDELNTFLGGLFLALGGSEKAKEASK